MSDGKLTANVNDTTGTRNSNLRERMPKEAGTHGNQRRQNRMVTAKHTDREIKVAEPTIS